VNQVGLVVEFANGSTYTACIFVRWSLQLTGIDVLARSLKCRLPRILLRAAVCKIGGDGCPSDDCFCAMPDYWSYWNLSGSDWVYSGAGASNNRLGPGEVDGWAFGPGDPPQVYTFSEICAPPPPTMIPTDTPALPSATPPPVFTPVPPTHTPPPQAEQPEPTDTALPPPTLQPSRTPMPVTPTVQLPVSPTPGQTHPPALRLTSTPTTTPSRTLPPPATDTQSSPPTPTHTLPAIPTLSPVPQDVDANGRAGSPAPYLVFIILVAGLGAGLIIVSRRRSP
jgi:hypothetical protein